MTPPNSFRDCRFYFFKTKLSLGTQNLNYLIKSLPAMSDQVTYGTYNVEEISTLL